MQGRRVLVVEDDFVLADGMEQALTAQGATVVGPAATVSQALGLIARAEPLDGAVLDIRLLTEWVYPVADVLRERGVPFVFATGYDRSSIDPRFAGIPRIEKPVDVSSIAPLLFG